MTRSIPPYLKLHEDSPPSIERVERPDQVAVLAAAVEQAIGWQVAVSQRREEGATAPPLALGGPLADMETGHDTAESVVSAEAAEQLLRALNDVCLELRQTRETLWRREAELAAAVPVAPRPDEESHLAERLEAILQGGAEAVGADAATLYVLNDETTQLKARACWGLSKQRLLDPPRPLRGAVADLEALVGHAVVLEDTSLLAHWKVPEEDFPSALCVPVSSPTTPLGTLWLFSCEPRDFTPEQTNMVEIVAGRLAADLDREVLMHEGIAGADLRRQRDLISSTQFERLPSIAPLLEGWDIAGWTTPSSDVLGDFFDWNVLPDGQLALAVGQAMGKGLEAAMTAGNLQTALRAHSGYRHDAREMVARLNETLWTGSAGDQFASIFYGLIDPESGEFCYATAGKVAAVLSDTSPIVSSSLPLGTQPEDSFQQGRAPLAPGGTLLLLSEGLLPLAQPSGRRRGPLSQLLEDSADADATEIAEAVRSQMLAKLNPLQRDCTLVVVKRRQR